MPWAPEPLTAASRWRLAWQPFHSRFARYIGMAAVALGGVAATGHFIGGFVGWWHLYEVTFHSGTPGLQKSTTDAKSRKLPRLSIVVLPLVSEGEARETEWFTDILASDLTTELGRFSGSLVISRDTAFTYKGKAVDPREVSRELGARYVVRGTVRRDGERVRLNLFMVDGESGAQHWAQQFDIERANLRQAIDDVALQVGRSLSVQLYRSEGKRAAALQPEEVQADDLAMRGWEVWYRGLNPENLQRARELFEAAVALDPNSIRGWGGVAGVNYAGVNFGWLPDRKAAIERVKQASSRLQQLDENDLFTFVARMNTALLARDFEGHLRTATEMVERFPNNPNAHFSRGFGLMNLGHFDQCTEPAKQAIRLGPRDVSVAVWRWQISACHFMRSEYRQAVEHGRAAVQANANLPLATMTLAASLARNGRAEEGRQLVADYLERFPKYSTEVILKQALTSEAPAFVEGRGRLIATLRELGVP
jgi:adenylate cyclase